MNATIGSHVLTSERDFFDRESAGLTDRELLLPADQFERYRHAREDSGNIAKDTLFARILPLDGKRVLDYGCGSGENACLLAACGARVTGFDLSPLSIEKARRRAELHGLADRVELDVAEAGKLPYEPQSFDLVTGFAILHHLHMLLPAVYAEIARVLRPGGTACFIEPVVNLALFRAARPWVPLSTDATPHERQLLYRDFDGLKARFAVVEFAHFHCLGRAGRVLGDRLHRPLRRLDHHLQRFLPWLRRCYGQVLVTARAPLPTPTPRSEDN